MQFATMSENGNTILIRENENRVAIITKKTLTDNQMNDIHWIISLMQETGLSLREIIQKGRIHEEE